MDRYSIPTSFIQWPARNFSFHPEEKFGKLSDYLHPRLHPTRNQRAKGDIRLFIPSTGQMPMGSFCGAHGYGLIHPNTINAAVIQLSFASSHSDAKAHWATPWDPTPQEKPDQPRAPFNMMSVAPNFDLQLEACTGDHAARAIVRYGPLITDDRSLVKTPGSRVDEKGSIENILKDVDVMLKAPRSGTWLGSTTPDQKNDSDVKCITRSNLYCHMRRGEDALAEIMSRTVTHMGANLRAYHFLCFQTQLGYRKSEPITLNEVSEVIPSVIEQGWLDPASRGTYSKYLDGDVHAIADDFRGKGKLKALWDITGYALQEGTWGKTPNCRDVSPADGDLLEYDGSKGSPYTSRNRW